jgi:hypothetical protein
MTKQRTFIVSAVVSGFLFFGWAAHAGFQWVRIPAATCVVQKGSSGTELNGATISAVSVSNTDVTMICPISTDTPDQYNSFRVHFIDKNSQRSFTANACVDFFAVTGGACFGEKSLSSSGSFMTPSGSVTEGGYPVFDTWSNHFGDFPFIKVRIPARQSCSGVACFGASSLRGVFLFTEM